MLLTSQDCRYHSLIHNTLLTDLNHVILHCVCVCVFSGSSTRRRLSRSPVGSGWRDGHSWFHREHGSGKSVSVLQRHRYSSLTLTCSCHVLWDVSSSICFLASQCASVSSLCSVRLLTWWVQIRSAMISQAGSVRSRTIHLCLTPAPCCRTPQCKRPHFYTAVWMTFLAFSQTEFWILLFGKLLMIWHCSWALLTF